MKRKFMQFVALVQAVLLLVPSLTFADPLYKEAIAYTERVNAIYVDVAKALAAASAQVAFWKAAYESAKAAYESANGNPVTSAAALAAMANAAVRLAQAQAALALATKIALIGAAGAAGFLAGTGYYQLGYAISDWCWDPVCQATYSIPGTPYAPVTDAELETAMPGLMHDIFDQSFVEADYTGDMAVAWDYMKRPLRMFVNLARGAASSGVNNQAEVAQAAADGQAEIDAAPSIMLSAATVLDTTDVIPASVELADHSYGTVKEALQQAITAAQEVILAANQPPGPEDPCQPGNGGPGCDNTDAIAASQALIVAAQGAIGLIDSVLVNQVGEPRHLIEFFRVGTLSDFRAFMQDVSQNGVSAVPEWEVNASDAVIQLAGVTFPSMPSFGPVLAGLDAGPSPEEEQAYFGTSSTATHSDILRASATTLSPGGRWLNMDLSESPLLGVQPRPGVLANAVLGAFPNPTAGVGASIRFTLTEPVEVRIRFYSVTGQVVDEVEVSGAVGTNDYAWKGGREPDRLRSGVYFYRLSARGIAFRNNNGRMVVLGSRGERQR